jgi:H/ACA ribonucleoprotein complex subunit 4
MLTGDRGAASIIKRVIMDRGTYRRVWGLGPVALETKRLINNGQLTEKGRPNDKTPANWLRDFLEGKLRA